MAGHFGGGVHGLPRDGRRRHLGDLGNIVANKKGVARYDRIEERWGVGTVLGRGVVVHEKEDVGTQPTGDAGSRIGTCVIGFANPDWKDDTYA